MLDELLAERRFRSYRPTGKPDGDAEAFRRFCEHEVMIEHPLGRRKLDLRDAQFETAQAYAGHDRVIILKARQVGYTTISMAWALWNCLFRTDWSCINLSKKEDDAKDALKKAIYAYNNLSEEMKERLPKRIDSQQRKISFANGSFIESHPSQDNPARGRTVALIILDELAFLPNPEDAWASVEPTTDIGGRIVALSTANGYGTLFHKMWSEAEDNLNGFHPYFASWRAVPERDENWRIDKFRTMQEWQVAQEYPTTPDEAFVKSGNPVFDVDLLRKIKPLPPLCGYLADGMTESPSDFEFRQQDAGPLRIHEKPQQGKVYVMGADVATNVEHGDYSSVHVLRTDTNYVVAHWHGKIDADLFGILLARIGWFYNTALAGVEANASGLTTLVALSKIAHYKRIYLRRSYGQRSQRPREDLGWYTSKATKPLMIDELNATLRDGTLGLYDEPTIAELLRYARDADGSTGGRPHDDRVISLAIANQMLKHAFNVEAQNSHLPQPGTWDYLFAKATAKNKIERTPIGRHSRRKRHRV